MAKNSKGLVFAVILIVGLMFVMLAFTEQTSANVPAEKATNCSKNYYAMNETLSGVNQCQILSQYYDYSLYVNGTSYTAFPTSPNLNNLPIITQTDACAVINNVSGNNTNKRFSMFVRAGTYNCKRTLDFSISNGITTLTGSDTSVLGTTSSTIFKWSTGVPVQAVNLASTQITYLTFQVTNTTNDVVLSDNGGDNILNAVYATTANVSGFGFNDNGHVLNQITNMNGAKIQISGSFSTITNYYGNGITLASGANNNLFYGTVTALATVTDNSGQTTNFSCPPVVDMPCGRNNVRVTSDQTQTANAAKSTTLTFSLNKNKNYVFEAQIFLTNTATSTANFQVHALPAGATLVMACATNGAIAVTTGNCATATATSLFGTPLSGATSTNIAVTIFGTITIGATAGTLQLDFLDVAALGTVTIKAGSFMTVNSVA